ncbi:hypothetical protein NQ315_000447 [Exocentrus adspersus]|uniref:Integrase catalytic domain-containing protein n=1 Tax=Exocentrus adspersus TaxID=1586481 RepID=A0AAV8V5B5_9CUCU|nr:hypothetical protein NQ315_000447 [Exocentrus adspersus]
MGKKKVVKIARRYGWSENDTLRLTALRLRGHAWEWYEGQSEKLTTWSDMKETLLKKFKMVIRFSSLLKRAANYEARPGQSLGDYCFQKLQKLQALRCNISDKCLIDAVIGGVKDEYVARIKHILNAVATPRANGQCERYNKTIVSSLAATAVGQPDENWDLYVKKVQSALNTTNNKAIGTTPMEALIGYRSACPAESVVLKAIENELEQLDIQSLRKDISTHMKAEQRRQKEYYDKTRRGATRFNQGDIVMVQITSEVATGSSRKLRPKYKGPYRVTKVLFNDRYEVQDMRDHNRHTTTVMASDRLKPWKGIVH